MNNGEEQGEHAPDEGDDDLTAEETKLLHFQELTGIDETERCREILTKYNWDLEVAMQSHLSEHEGSESVFNQPRPAPPVEQRAPQVYVDPPDQRSLHSPRHAGPTSNVGVLRRVVGWLSFLFLFPFHFTYSTISSIFNFLYNLVRPDPRLIVSDPLGDVESFIQVFSERYGVVHPAWRHSTYSQVLNEAKENLRFLFIYLHSSQQSDSDRFCRATLCSNEFVDFINASMICWGCDVNSPEGYRVARALRVSTHPFVGLIVLRQSRMTVVARSEGFVDGEGLRQQLARIMRSNELNLMIARAEREERQFNSSLRLEQDEAYNQSLRADQEKSRLRQEQLKREKLEEEEALRRSLEEERQRQELTNRKEEMRARLGDEPPSDHPNTLKILLKLPNGVRLERRFLTTDSLEVLYNFVYVHEAAPDDFQIVTSYPRRDVPCHPLGGNAHPPTFEEFGLGKAELLFVHDNQA